MNVEQLELRGGRVSTLFRAGSGPTVVYFHAASGIAKDDPFVGRLAEHYSVIAPLAPGFEDLAELDDLDDVHDLAMHYDDIFSTLHLWGVPVIGHSFGGMMAAELAAHYPKRPSKLVLIDPIGLWLDEYPVADMFATPPTELANLVWVDPQNQAARDSTAAASADVGAATPEQIADQIIPMVQGLASVAKYIWPIPDKGLRKRLDRVLADTLVIWGAQDQLVDPVYAQEFARRIPSARVELVEDAGHMVPLEQPERVMELITTFLADEREA